MRVVQGVFEGFDIDIKVDIKLAARHGDGFLDVLVAVPNAQRIGRPRAAGDDAGQRIFGVVAALEELPVAVVIPLNRQVVAQDNHIFGFPMPRSQVLAIGKIGFHFGNDMARHHVNAVPARFKERVETRIRAAKRELDAVIASLFDFGLEIVQLHLPAGLRAIEFVFEGINGIDDIIGVEFLAVAPHHALTQFDRHLGEVVIVDRISGRQRMDERAGFLIAVPECLVHQRVEKGRMDAALPNVPVCLCRQTIDAVKDPEILAAARHLDRQALRLLRESDERRRYQQRQQEKKYKLPKHTIHLPR